MSLVSYQAFVASKPFLIVRPGEGLFYAHGQLLADVSPVMRIDVEGEMSGKRLETIELQAVDGDIDDATVSRFIKPW